MQRKQSCRELIPAYENFERCGRCMWGNYPPMLQHAGNIWPSDYSHASPAFIIPKADTMALPWWVNDYWQLNDNTVSDSHPLPRIDDILNDCAKGKHWGAIDMTNSFFQTPMHIDDILVMTPFGLYEWMVMLMGLKNAPPIHQRCVTAALWLWLGKICHIYLDDIVVWSNSIEEHIKNVETILQALCEVHLYCNLKKTHLLCTEINFLGHHIVAWGIEADGKKTERIMNWPHPESATQVRQFLGLIHYVSGFL